MSPFALPTDRESDGGTTVRPLVAGSLTPAGSPSSALRSSATPAALRADALPGSAGGASGRDSIHGLNPDLAVARPSSSGDGGGGGAGTSGGAA